MAKKFIETVIDDLDGTEVEPGTGESIDFSVGTSNYVIDLSTKNAEAFRAALEPYIAAATKVRKNPMASVDDRVARRHELAAAREWLRENGYNVSQRGRVAQAHIDIYRAAVKK